MSEQFVEDLLALINKLRTTPTSCTSLIQDFKQSYIQNYSYKTDIIDELSSIASKLSSKSASCSALQVNETLTEIANDLLNQLHNTKGTKFYAQDQDYLEVLLGMELEGVKASRNYLSTEKDQEKLLLNILVNDEDIQNKNHALIDPKIRYIGIAHGTVKGQEVTIIVVTDSVIPKKEKQLEDGLVDEISKVRENPRAFVKYFASEKNGKEVVNFLLKAKRLGQLIPNEMLEKAAEERANQYHEDKKEKSYEELVDFLENYGSRYSNVAEIFTEGVPNALTLVVELLSDPAKRELVFNRKFTQIGIYQHPETGVLTLLFADIFDAKVEMKALHVLSLRRRLHRPNLTEDEENQIRNDFRSFDIVNAGLIKPSTILLFAEKDNFFAENNPFYYKALKNLNTEENNENGVNVDEFIAAVKRAIKEYDEDFSNWKDVFNLYFESGKKKKVIDKDILKKTIKDMGFKVNDEDIDDLVTKMDGELDQEKFCNIMKYIEARFSRH